MSDQPGIAVLLCACRPEMKERLDYEGLSSYISSLEGVVHVERHPVWCLAPGLARLKQVIEEKGIDRIVVAGCSYRIHRQIFAEVLREAGLNPYMLEIVNVRDHCAAVHPDGATERARDQIAMAVTRAQKLQPLSDITVDAVQRALIIGGGLSGLIAADTLAASGCDVVIVEKEETLGGHISSTRPWRVRRNGKEALPEIVAGIESNPSIEKICSSTVSRVDGDPGGFTVTIDSPGGERQVEAGAIIVATGSAGIPAEGAYGHDGTTVRTQEEFESILYSEKPAEKPLSIVMIQCVNSRNEERPYCSRVCCLDAVRNATAAKEKWPETEVAILFRDLEKGCLTERDVKRALDAGVVFHRFDESSPPEVENGKVKLVDTLTGGEVAILYDLIVLSVGEVPGTGTGDIARALNIPTDAFGFVPEPTMRIRPKDFTGRGIFVTGSAHWPLTPEESMYQAFEMASRAAIEIKKGTFTTRPIVATVDESKCIGCHLCESMCAWDAIRVSDPAEGNKARVREILCKGCGTCVASCPAFALQLTYYSDEQIRPAIIAAVTS